ncbi:MAG: bifunctional hydroxymethylpyrimidine kinase/phosphomethylpyrimidine kinase [Alphaproteobacteria bacterium]|nr:bifunctional hydroxymethylpyrimidine kinase/phosphomethylpyrimidine kinase [Alphaproteobacteria bacterium]
MTDLAPPTRLSGRVLIVGVSEASGGIGIQAAIKTVTALGAFAAATVTAVLAETTEPSYAVPPVAVAAQMRAALADIGADILVIGGLAGAGLIEAVADVLEGEARGIPLVVDLADATDAARAMLIPLARIVVAPSDAADLDGQRKAAAGFARAGRAALVTSAAFGDVLADGATLSVFPAGRGAGRSVRGGGLSLAAAIATGLAQGLPLAAAVRRGRDYVEEAILTAPDFGRGASPLNHVHTLRPTPPSGFES